jgi:hypothetical protein
MPEAMVMSEQISDLLGKTPKVPEMRQIDAIG